MLTTELEPFGRTPWDDTGIIQVRPWAAQTITVVDRAIKIGSAPDCDLQLHDRSRKLSRVHAVLTPTSGGCRVEDLQSTNGTKIDGTAVTVGTLAAGARLQLGGVVLVAETPRFCALRALMSRYLGWGSERQLEIDQALQSLRELATRNVPLLLTGQEPLLPIAERLHAATMANAGALHVQHGKRRHPDASVDAIGGTLCVADATSAVMNALLALQRSSERSFPHLLFCHRTDRRTKAPELKVVPGSLATISIPSLNHRQHELPRIITETVADIIEQEGLGEFSLGAADRDALGRISCHYITDLEAALRRLILGRSLKIVPAAARLGIAHSTLSKWLDGWNRQPTNRSIDLKIRSKLSTRRVE